MPFTDRWTLQHSSAHQPWMAPEPAPVAADPEAEPWHDPGLVAEIRFGRWQVEVIEAADGDPVMVAQLGRDGPIMDSGPLTQDDLRTLQEAVQRTWRRFFPSLSMPLPSPGRPRRVIVESPFASDNPVALVDHRMYLTAALRDSIDRGEAPFASHALYTRPGVLDDWQPEERQKGIAAGLGWHGAADAMVVYCDLGMSGGMRQGITNAERIGLPVEYRSLPEWAAKRRAAS